MFNYQTPDVYTEEIAALAPSVAGVSTAIPAFIGYTEMATKDSKSVVNSAVLISTMLEYKEIFGGPDTTSFTVMVNEDESIDGEVLTDAPGSTLYYQLDLYFKNGGGACYVVSIGNYTASPTRNAFLAGLEAVSKEDEPTLIMLGEATHLRDADYYEVCTLALAQCADLKDRFCIFDVLPTDADAAAFREGIGMNNLKYGAAYTPYLQTSINYLYNEANVLISGLTTGEGAADVTLDSIKASKSALYSKIVTKLAKQCIVLPPGAAVAGAYATTDRERGVWKAPANISLNAVIAPIEKITAAAQGKLNDDQNAGKSINAIRSFSGKGTLIWGARTLAGNDNEWRYVPVRRLFNMIEESTKKATYFAVFEPNDAATWLKVKAMIDSYLYGIWQQGALAGSTAGQAYFVNIGLGKTMTQQDMLEGRMIVEIGIAAVRPAEFIILRFSHKLQES